MRNQKRCPPKKGQHLQKNNMVMTNERGQNTHSKGERVKIPLLPYNVDKRKC